MNTISLWFDMRSPADFSTIYLLDTQNSSPSLNHPSIWVHVFFNWHLPDFEAQINFDLFILHKRAIPAYLIMMNNQSTLKLVIFIASELFFVRLSVITIRYLYKLYVMYFSIHDGWLAYLVVSFYCIIWTLQSIPLQKLCQLSGGWNFYYTCWALSNSFC